MTRFLIVEFGNGLWGAQQYLLRLRPLLEREGFVAVLAAAPQSDLAEAWRDDGGTTVLAEASDRSVRTANDQAMSPRLLVREAARTVRSVLRLRRVAARCEAELLHANSHWAHLDVALAGRLSRTPVLLHLHEQSKPGMGSTLRGVAVLLATRSIAVSDAVRDSVPRWARRRVVTVRNGVDLEVFRPAPSDPSVRAELSADPDALVLLVLGRLDPSKGVDTVIRAVAAAQRGDRRPIHLAIAGTGSLDLRHEADLRILAGHLLGDRCRFLGYRSDVVPLIQAADGIVCAGRVEGLPLVVLEAMACGSAPVVLRVAGTPEVVEDGVTGLLAAEESELARKIAELAADPKLSTALGERARAWSEADGGIERQADQVAAVMRATTRRRRGAQGSGA